MNVYPERGAFATLVVDPPWSYNDRLQSGNSGFGAPKGVRGAANHYSVLDTPGIAALPVGEYAAPDAHIYLWVTNAFMEDGFALMRAWGFEFKTILTWVKPQIGMGHYFRNNTEHVLFGVRGSLPTKRNDCPTAFTAPRRRHSEKPDAFFDLVESMSPGPYLSVFERRWRMGWSAVGDEVGVTLTS